MITYKVYNHCPKEKDKLMKNISVIVRKQKLKLISSKEILETIKLSGYLKRAIGEKPYAKEKCRFSCTYRKNNPECNKFKDSDLTVVIKYST